MPTLKRSFPTSDGEREGRFELLCPAVVFPVRARAHKRSTDWLTKPSPANAPLHDEHPDQCIVTWAEELSEGVVIHRCTEPTHKDDTNHGFLCEKHYAESRPQVRRDNGMGQIRDILATEREAIAQGTVTRWKVTKEVTFSYLEPKEAE